MIKHLTWMERMVVNRYLIEHGLLLEDRQAWHGWPSWAPKQYNACNEPCDMWTGACCCGATHLMGR